MTNSNSNSKALAGLRIAVGALFLIFGEYKVFGTEFTLGGGFQYWINRFLEEGAYPFMIPVLQNFVLHLAKPIAFLVAYGELAIGLALVLGILVRPASICGVIYMLTLLVASNYPAPMPDFGSTSVLHWNTWHWHFASPLLLWESRKKPYLYGGHTCVIADRMRHPDDHRCTCSSSRTSELFQICFFPAQSSGNAASGAASESCPCQKHLLDNIETNVFASDDLGTAQKRRESRVRSDGCRPLQPTSSVSCNPSSYPRNGLLTARVAGSSTFRETSTAAVDWVFNAHRGADAGWRVSNHGAHFRDEFLGGHHPAEEQVDVLERRLVHRLIKCRIRVVGKGH